MDKVRTTPNPDLEAIDGKGRWNNADYRRHGFHHLHQIARYSMSFRAASVMSLQKRMVPAMADLEAVRHLTALPWFSAMVIARGSHILFERYAGDFGKDQPHSLQSITKTTVNLMVGQLVEAGGLDLSRTIAHYIPQIGSGYAKATLQQVLNMDVVNDYTEDFADPQAAYYRHEEAMGWRLPRDLGHEPTERGFIAGIHSDDTTNRWGHTQYKDANTAVIGWVVERVSGRPLRAFLAEIVDAVGLEAAFHITTDRDGVPTIEGGACLTARDLARYFALYVRGGCGVNGRRVGSQAFIERSVSSGVPMPAPYEGIRYSNHLMVRGRTVGHGGWGGQYALANLETGIIGVFLSVAEDQHALGRGYQVPIIQMLESITGKVWEC
jgi:CubicO group peptidase (beta-lactamase class C family)